MYIGLLYNTCYSCHILMKIEFWGQVFEKYLKCKISGKSVHWEPSYSMWTDRRTDMTKLVVAFRSFVKAPKRNLIQKKWDSAGYN
jgi:hypothetical protein